MSDVTRVDPSNSGEVEKVMARVARKLVAQVTRALEDGEMVVIVAVPNDHHTRVGDVLHTIRADEEREGDDWGD
jgi:hypothetical protein